LQEGDVWRLHVFIVRGCLRTYSIDEKGVEHIMDWDRQLVGSGTGKVLKSGKSSKFNIDAVSNSEVILIKDRDFNRLLAEIPAFSEMIHYPGQKVLWRHSEGSCPLSVTPQKKDTYLP